MRAPRDELDAFDVVHRVASSRASCAPALGLLVRARSKLKRDRDGSSSRRAISPSRTSSTTPLTRESARRPGAGGARSARRPLPVEARCVAPLLVGTDYQGSGAVPAATAERLARGGRYCMPRARAWPARNDELLTTDEPSEGD